MSDALRENGHSLAVASTWAEFQQLCQEEPFDIAILDWSLNETIAVDLLHKLSSGASETSPHIIAVVPDGLDATELETVKAHSDWCLSTPLDFEDLIAKVLYTARVAMFEGEERARQRKVEQIQSTLELANKSLTIASRRFEELFRGLPVASFTFDGQGVIHEWNRQAEVLFEVPPYLAFDRHIWDIMGEASTDIWNIETVESVLSGNAITNCEWKYVSSSGCERYLVCSVIPLTGGTGKIVGAISANLDITDRVLAEQQIEWQMQEIQSQKEKLEAANSKLEKLAETDGLTGLINHRKMYELLDQACQDEGRGLSAILMDVDSFKSFNDTYGHLAGDQVLRLVGRIATDTVGSRGIPARYGGEEFAVLLFDTPAEEAVVIADEVRAALEGYNWDLRSITVSVGVSTRINGTAGADLLRQCDTALYMAKGTGKNRVVHFGSMSEADLAAWEKAA